MFRDKREREEWSIGAKRGCSVSLSLSLCLSVSVSSSRGGNTKSIANNVYDDDDKCTLVKVVCQDGDHYEDDEDSNHSKNGFCFTGKYLTHVGKNTPFVLRKEEEIELEFAWTGRSCD